MQSLFSDKDDQLRSSFTNQGSSFPRTPSEYMTYNAYSHVPSEMGLCTIALIRFSSVIAALIIFHFCMYSDDTMLLNPLAEDFIPNIFNPSAPPLLPRVSVTFSLDPCASIFILRNKSCKPVLKTNEFKIAGELPSSAPLNHLTLTSLNAQSGFNEFDNLVPTSNTGDIHTPSTSGNDLYEISEWNTTSPILHDLTTPTQLESSDIQDISCVLKSKWSEHLMGENAEKVLKEIRIKNVNRTIIGTLNINSMSAKFEQLKLIIGTYLDILVIEETKLDPSFPDDQFFIDGYKSPYRLDRNRSGGGLIIYVREDIPSKLLNKHNFTANIEGLFIDINLRKTKLLLFGTYHSTRPIYGTNDENYFKEVGQALDIYCNYEIFLLAGDFNKEENENCLNDFLSDYNAKNLVKENTCFKSLDNPSCIDLFLTNSHQRFQHITTVCTGLSDFHKMLQL